MASNATPTLPILAAVDALMAAIRANHPDVPPVTIVLGAKGAKKNGMTYGHFAPGSWTGEVEHEVMLSGESLSRGAEATLGTLIHEAAHATAHNTGVVDTSNQGRYHNKKFKAIAESMGIVLEPVPTRGWTKTTLAEGTADKYKDGLAVLTEALTTYKKTSGGSAAPAKPRNSTKIKIDCECENPVTVSKIWFESHGDIQCGDCLANFVPVS